MWELHISPQILSVHLRGALQYSPAIVSNLVDVGGTHKPQPAPAQAGLNSPKLPTHWQSQTSLLPLSQGTQGPLPYNLLPRADLPGDTLPARGVSHLCMRKRTQGKHNSRPWHIPDISLLHLLVCACAYRHRPQGMCGEQRG